ncbi:putative glycerol kinase 5 [Alligator mississippiensis]|uniref:Glycerol kinase 5 n=1 Tax=Alligator mississippiensis TaxID=8496 RepID=A0A151NAY0_ALLMI|nr:putative glycerol kinase 5 [Alligator mississippiensis]KYO33907.1 putative glycerol kinase 5 isoform B [Alligator mississippiensis]
MPRGLRGDPAATAAAPAYVASVDVGSTGLKCRIYDGAAAVRGASCQEIKSLHPRPGWVELDPEVLWTQFTDVLKEAVQGAGLRMNQIAGLGISTQRATFITWNKKTGKPFHNFISWQDLRTAELVSSWNRGLMLKVLHIIFTMLHFLTRSTRYLAASLFTFSTHHSSLKLSWIFQNITEVHQAAKENNCCFGTIDTWLLYKLTKGSVYATDYSNASSTGLFDPFTRSWSSGFCKLLSIPMSIYPPVKDTSCNFGSVDPEIFGVPIPIMALVADQQSATFGECCFHPGDVKLTMGTGTFWNVNTGSQLHAPRGGLYSLIGWKIGKEVVYLTEGNASDTGSTIKWAQRLDLFTSVEDTSKMARSVVDSEGVCFVPSFRGLQASVNDPYLCASFVGLKTSTTRNHLVRAILESIAFRNKQLYDIFLKELQIPLRNIRADGGVSNNSFIMQMTSDLINKKIDKPVNTDASGLGAAFLAGLALGVWTDKEQLKKLRRTEVVFEPQKDSREYKLAMDSWTQAVQRSLH